MHQARWTNQNVIRTIDEIFTDTGTSMREKQPINMQRFYLKKREFASVGDVSRDEEVEWTKQSAYTGNCRC